MSHNGGKSHNRYLPLVLQKYESAPMIIFMLDTERVAVVRRGLQVLPLLWAGASILRMPLDSKCMLLINHKKRMHSKKEKMI